MLIKPSRGAQSALRLADENDSGGRYLAQIVHHVSDQVVVLPISWRADPADIASRLVNVGAKGRQATQAWNGHEWMCTERNTPAQVGPSHCGSDCAIRRGDERSEPL